MDTLSRHFSKIAVYRQINKQTSSYCQKKSLYSCVQKSFNNHYRNSFIYTNNSLSNVTRITNGHTTQLRSHRSSQNRVSSTRRRRVAFQVKTLTNSSLLSLLKGFMASSYLLEGAKKYKRQIVFFLVSFFASILGGLIAFYASHVEEAPITKRKRFIGLSEKQMMQMSLIVEEKLHKCEHLSPSDWRVVKVEGIVARLINANADVLEMQARSWPLSVLNKSHRAASAFPSGRIVISADFLQLLSNDDEIAIILSHEMSHVLLGHLDERISHTFLVDILLIVPVLLLWALLPVLEAAAGHVLSSYLAEVMLELPYSRFLEREADLVGLQLAAKACFDVRVAGPMWARFEDQCRLQPRREQPEWLSSHPSTGSRARALHAALPEALALRDRHNCPPLD